MYPTLTFTTIIVFITYHKQHRSFEISLRAFIIIEINPCEFCVHNCVHNTDHYSIYCSCNVNNVCTQHWYRYFSTLLMFPSWVKILKFNFKLNTLYQVSFIVATGFRRWTLLAVHRCTLHMCHSLTKERNQIPRHEEFYSLPAHTFCKLQGGG